MCCHWLIDWLIDCIVHCSLCWHSFTTLNMTSTTMSRGNATANSLSWAEYVVVQLSSLIILTFFHLTLTTRHLVLASCLTWQSHFTDCLLLVRLAELSVCKLVKCCLSVYVCVQLDSELRCKWDDAMSRGCFRYQLNDVQTRIVAGKHQFVLQVRLLYINSLSDFIP